MNYSPIIVVAVLLIKNLLTEIIKAGKAASKNLQKLRLKKGEELLGNNFIDSFKLFIRLNQELPNVMVIRELNVNDALVFLNTNLRNEIKTIYRHNQFDFDDQCGLFNMMIIVTKDNKVIEIGRGYIELLYSVADAEWANEMANKLATYRVETNVKVLSGNIRVTGFAGSLN